MAYSSLPQRTKSIRRGPGPRRKPIDRTTPEEQAKETIRTAVYARDRRCLLRGALGTTAGPCAGQRLTPHHLWKDGQGGPWSMRNIVALCAGHNGWVEDHPTEARAWGLVVERNMSITEVWRRMILNGLVGYWWDASAGYLASPDCVRAEQRIPRALMAAMLLPAGPEHRPPL